MATKILIGEDEALVAMDLEMTLNQMGYFVVGIASTGERIIALNRENKPDLILLDICLDGTVDGFQAATQIQKESGVLILFVSAGTDTEMPQKPENRSIYGFLRKPFSNEELEEAISGLLRERKRERKKRKK